MTLVLDPVCFDLDRASAMGRRVVRALRYGGVLCVWMGLFVIRPHLALQIFRERRSDSPLRRRA